MPAKSEHIYRHTTVSRFQITGHPGEKPFDFKNNLLKISESTPEETEKRNERFLDLVGQMHPRDRAQIKKINTDVAAKLESALGPRVSRGSQDTSEIRAGVRGPDGQNMMNQNQIDELAKLQAENDQKQSEQEAADAAAIEDAKRILAEQGADAAEQAEKERLARVAEEEAKTLPVAEVETTAAVADPLAGLVVKAKK